MSEDTNAEDDASGEQPDYRPTGDELREAVDSDAFEGGLWDEHPLYPAVKGTLEKYEDNDILQRELIHTIGMAIGDHYNVIRPPEETHGWRPCLWRFDPELGIYKPDGDQFVKSQTLRLCGAILSPSARDNVLKNVRDYVTRPKPWFNTPDSHLVVGNGILDVTSGELMDYNPEEPHQIRIAAEWPDDPDAATCDEFDSFLTDIVNPSDVDTMYRLIAHMLHKGYPSSKAAMLSGDGANGKGTFSAAVRRFLHPGEEIANNREIHDNVAGESLQSIASTTDQWAEGRLAGSLANIDADMGSDELTNTETFKKATGGKDVLTANSKYKETYPFVNHATMTFCVNEVPRSADDSDGYWRRWVYINFPNTFRPSDDDFVPEDELLDSLSTPEEKSALLVRCVQELQRWDDTGIFYPDVPEPSVVRREMKKASDSVYAFAMDCLVEDDSGADDAYVTKDDAREAYRRYCDVENLPRISNDAFSKRILDFSDIRIETGQTRQEGPSRVTVYRGVQWSQRGAQIRDGEEPSEADTEQSRMDGVGPDAPGFETETPDRSDAGTTEAAAEVMKALYDAEHRSMEYGELMLTLSEKGIDTPTAVAGVEKTVERGDVMRNSGKLHVV